MWQLTPRGMVSFCGSYRNKNAHNTCAAFRCGTDWPGWLDGAHPTVEDGEVFKKVCFSYRPTCCRYTTRISVKNCGSYFIYKLIKPPCPLRYCSADWMWSKHTSRRKRTDKSLRRYMYIKFWHVRYSTFLLYRKHYHYHYHHYQA